MLEYQSVVQETNKIGIQQYQWDNKSFTDKSFTFNVSMWQNEE